MTDLAIMVGGIGFALGLAWLLTYAEDKLRGGNHSMMERHEELDRQDDARWGNK